jgi:hypothetical protein
MNPSFDMEELVIWVLPGNDATHRLARCLWDVHEDELLSLHRRHPNQQERSR